MRRSFVALLTLTGIVCFLGSCESDETVKQNARIEVWLTDGPGDFEKVNIDVQSVEIHASEMDNGQGWVALDTQAGIYDLLTLVNGEDTLISTLDLPAGRLSQIRLTLGENNSVVVGGEEFGVTIPSGSQSGLKLQVSEDLREGITYKVTLDFDVARSIVKTGAGNYILKPLIRVITEAENGAIEGVVQPAESTPAIFAITGDDTVATTFPDDAGLFLLRGIPAGTYTVTFEPNENFAKHQVENVAVETGNVTTMEPVTLTEN